MNFINNIFQKFMFFENETQKIGLSQFKENHETKKVEPSIKSKDVKLSDLMRRS